jgi:hypothetical protein
MSNQTNKTGATDINLFLINNTEADLSAHLGVCQVGLANDTNRVGWKNNASVFKCAEIHTANLSALSALDATPGFLYQTGAAAFTRYPFAGTGSALSVAHSDHAHSGVYATGSLSVGKIPYCSNATGPVLSDSILSQSGGNVGIGYTAPLSSLCVNGGVNIGGQNAIDTDGLRLSIDSAHYLSMSIYNDVVHSVFSAIFGVTGTGGSLNINCGNQAVISANTQMDLYCPSVSVLGTLNVGSIDPCGAGETLRLTYDSTHYAVLKEDSSGNLSITTAGNVGIGTTNPTAKLQIGMSTGGPAAGVALFVPSADIEAGNLIIGYGNNSANISTDDASKPITFSVGGSERMRIDNGNVGIGTTNPLATLNIMSDTAYLRLSSVTNCGGINAIQFSHSGSTYNFPKTAIVTQSNGTVGSGASDMYFVLNGTSDGNPYNIANDTRMIIKASGNVGIGYTAPLSALCVNGGINIGSDAALASGLGITLSSTADNKSFSFLESTTPKASIKYYGTAYSNAYLRGLWIAGENKIVLSASGVGAKVDISSQTFFESGIVLASSGTQTDTSNGGAVNFECTGNHTLEWTTAAPTSDLVVTITGTPVDGMMIFIHSFNQNDCVKIIIGGNWIMGCCGYNQRSAILKYANSQWVMVSNYLGAV